MPVKQRTTRRKAWGHRCLIYFGGKMKYLVLGIMLMACEEEEKDSGESVEESSESTEESE